MINRIAVLISFVAGMVCTAWPVSIFSQEERRISSTVLAPEKHSFRQYLLESPGIKLYRLFVTNDHRIFLLTSIGLSQLDLGKLSPPVISHDDIYKIEDTGAVKKDNSDHRNATGLNAGTNDQARGNLAQSGDGTYYFIANNKLFIWRDGGKVYKIDWPTSTHNSDVSIIKLWLDSYGNIYAGAENGGFYVTEVAKTISDKNHIDILDAKIKRFEAHSIEGFSVHSFIQDPKDKNRIWLGTSLGLFYYDINHRSLSPASKSANDRVTVTELAAIDRENIWFSSLEKAMAKYNINDKTIEYFPYAERHGKSALPVRTFCIKSQHKFFVLLSDYYPVIFDTRNQSYSFTSDSVLTQSSYQTSELKQIGKENFLFLKGGKLYQSENPESNWAATKLYKVKKIISFAPFIKSIELLDGTPLATLDYFPQRLKKILLNRKQNNLIIYCDADEFAGKSETNFSWKIDGYSDKWQPMAKTSFDSVAFVQLVGLNPGSYKFELKVVYGQDEWIREGNTAELMIVIRKPIWQNWWFWVFLISGLAILIYTLAALKLRAVRKKERLNATYEKQLMELEAKALRAQMNPHFIFNCLNSIKAIIQNDEKQKATDYLTTFAKLIRTLFQNSDKLQITLHDEIETCRLYTQLETMRLSGKLQYSFEIDPDVDLKSVMVPALIIQPFIENAIWHGIAPKEGGTISVSLRQNENDIICEVEDDGIGRESSRLNKPMNPVIHQSKGVHLSQSRIDLEKKLSDTNASIKIIDKYENEKATGTKVVITFGLQ